MKETENAVNDNTMNYVVLILVAMVLVVSTVQAIAINSYIGDVKTTGSAAQSGFSQAVPVAGALVQDQPVATAPAMVGGC